ncbi:MAG: (d)CMP kinase [Deinococcus sp.]|nr:(d)CMP kinase [Deinococcus sp.]
MIITIDGPAASGKSTLAHHLSQELGIPYVNSGLLYRLAALLAQEAGVRFSDGPAVAALVERSDVELQVAPGQPNAALRDGEDVTLSLYQPDIATGASQVAVHPLVRHWVTRKLRALKSPDLIAEGRDMGSVVYPQATWKFFLTADAGERAGRRAREPGVSVGETPESLRERDQRDSQRGTAPLSVPEGAVVIDTTGLTPEEVLAQVLGAVRQRT